MSQSRDEALASARQRDFLLIEREDDTSFLLYIAHLDHNPLDGVRIFVKRCPHPTRRDVWNYQRYGTWLFEITNWDIQPKPLTVVIHQSDWVTVRPTVERLRELIGGGCVYQGCEEGLVRTIGATQLAVPWRPSIERIMAGQESAESYTICPFCMGWELFERHEYLANAWTADTFPAAVSRAHRRAINAQRLRMRYEWLLPGVSLSTLTHTPRARPLEEAVGQTATPGETQPRALSPELSTHSFGWFRNARERVFVDGCAICRDPFQDGETIVDLPCEHFYHDRCIGRHFRSLGASPTCPYCNHAVALR